MAVLIGRCTAVGIGILVLLVCGGVAGANGSALPRLEAGTPYPEVRRALLSSGWQPVPADRTYLHDKQPPYGYEELVCGTGWQAVCAANFARSGAIVCLHLKPGTESAVYESYGPEC